MSDNIRQQALSCTRELMGLLLWHAEAIQISRQTPFRLVSGNYSPIYVDCRRAISDPVLMHLFTAIARSIITWAQLEVDVIAGGETAGIPFAAFLAQATARPMIYVRKAPKDHGVASRIEGQLARGARVLLVEDLITDAGSKLAFISAIRAAGGLVQDVLVLFDRLQGGRAALESEGIRLHSVTDMDVALSVAEQAGVVDEHDLSSARDYLCDPRRWHRDRGLEYNL